MSDQSPFQGQPDYVAKPSSKKRLLILFVIVLILLIAGLIGLYYLGTSPKHKAVPAVPIPTLSEKPSVTAEPTASISATPAASPSAAKVDQRALTVQVLNGSGTAGAAQKIASQLTKAGYTKVTTGNAKIFTYQGLTIITKKSTKEAADTLQKDLSSADPGAKIATQVDDTIATDAEVIVGK